MRKNLFFIIMCFVLSGGLFGFSSVQTKTFPSLGWANPGFTRTLTFDQWDSSICPLSSLYRINITMSISATGYDMNLDNDGENPGNVTCYCGTSGELSSDDVWLFSASNAAICADVQATDQASYNLIGNDGDATDQVNYDADFDDYAEFSATDQTVTDNDDVGPLWYNFSGRSYIGTGTFDIDVDVTDVFGTTGEDSGVNYTAIGGTAQGYVRITYYWSCDGVLPVELSEFMAIQNTENLAELTWIVQSESEMSGYNIYRNIDSDVQNAIQVNNELIEAFNSSEEHSYSFIDKTAEYGLYYYWLEMVDNDGSTQFSEVAGINIQPIDDYGSAPEFEALRGIQSIYPNPFNPSVNISYYLSEQADVFVEVYNVKGQKIYEFNEGSKTAGMSHTVVWDGKNMNNQTAASGIYLFKLSAGNFTEVKKAVLGK